MSVIYYKFASAKAYSTITFDGTALSVFDLKKSILLQQKLKGAAEFDLATVNAQTNEEYINDTQMVPRSTSIIVKRRPAAKPGKGTAQKYLVNAHPVAPRGSGAPPSGPPQRPTRAPPAQRANGPDMSEEDKIKNMFQQAEQSWNAEQERMSTAAYIHRPAGSSVGAWGERRTPKPGYVCYRCGNKDHFIQDCPTIGDPEFDNRKKLKPTTGIPRMFLKTVDKPPAGADAAGTDGAMVTQDGTFVVQVANEQAFKKITTIKKFCARCKRSLEHPLHLECCRIDYCADCMDVFDKCNDCGGPKGEVIGKRPEKKEEAKAAVKEETAGTEKAETDKKEEPAAAAAAAGGSSSTAEDSSQQQQQVQQPPPMMVPPPGMFFPPPPFGMPMMGFLPGPPPPGMMFPPRPPFGMPPPPRNGKRRRSRSPSRSRSRSRSRDRRGSDDRRHRSDRRARDKDRERDRGRGRGGDDRERRRRRH